MGGGCRACDECNAEPYLLDDNCFRCWNCSKDEGVLRWDDTKNSKTDTKQPEKDKKQLIEVKTK